MCSEKSAVCIEKSRLSLSMHSGVLLNQMARSYTLGRRAEKQAETRQRIVEAAVDLHASVGPARTTISMIAERACVQRHTLYAHFPDEWSILLACSDHSLARDPPPDAAAWREIRDRDRRLRTGLRAIYDWYERNDGLFGCVLRDAEHHDGARRIAQMRFAPLIAAYREMLGAGQGARQRALLGLALSFFTWRSLTRDGGLIQAAAVAAMANAIEAA
jgi:AcrR family transcriptional regulator